MESKENVAMSFSTQNSTANVDPEKAMGRD